MQPGPGDEVGAADLVAVRLGQAVDRLGEQLGRLVRLVPALVGVLLEAEVRGQVDDLEPALAQLRDGLGGRLVRIGDDGGVGALGDRVGVGRLHRERHPVGRIELVVAATRVGARGEHRQLDRRMPVQDRRRDRAAVARRAEHGRR